MASLVPVHIGIFSKQSFPHREVLIKGVLKRGSRLQIAATSKGYKTWLLISLAIALSTGRKWMRIQCSKCKVLYINFELYEDAAQERVNEIAAAIGIDLDGADLHILNRRRDKNQLIGFFEMLKRTLDAAETAGIPYDVIILDPIYKLYAKGMQENDAGAVKELLDTISECTELRPRPVSTIYTHHYAKGDQSKKFAKERSSGSGTYQRDPDALINFTEHKNEGSHVVSFSLREFPPQPEFVVTWKHPLMQNNDDARARDIRKAPGAPEKVSRNDLLPFINGEWISRKELLAATMKKIDMCERTFDNKLNELETVGEIERIDGNIRRIQQVEHD